MTKTKKSYDINNAVDSILVNTNDISYLDKSFLPKLILIEHLINFYL